MGLLSWVCQILNYSNWTIIKGDMAIFVNKKSKLTFDLLFIQINPYQHAILKCKGGPLFMGADNFQRFEFWQVWKTVSPMELNNAL